MNQWLHVRMYTVICQSIAVAIITRKPKHFLLNRKKQFIVGLTFIKTQLIHTGYANFTTTSRLAYWPHPYVLYSG